MCTADILVQDTTTALIFLLFLIAYCYLTVLVSTVISEWVLTRERRKYNKRHNVIHKVYK